MILFFVDLPNSGLVSRAFFSLLSVGTGIFSCCRCTDKQTETSVVFCIIHSRHSSKISTARSQTLFFNDRTFQLHVWVVQREFVFELVKQRYNSQSDSLSVSQSSVRMSVSTYTTFISSSLESLLVVRPSHKIESRSACLAAPP